MSLFCHHRNHSDLTVNPSLLLLCILQCCTDNDVEGVGSLHLLLLTVIKRQKNYCLLLKYLLKPKVKINLEDCAFDFFNLEVRKRKENKLLDNLSAYLPKKPRQNK